MVVGGRVAEYAREQSLLFPFSLVEEALAAQERRLEELRGPAKRLGRCL